MNYFTKNRILIWVVIAAFAINISAIATILYRVNKGKFRTEKVDFRHRPHDIFKKELNLTAEQEKQFMEMKKASREEAEPIVIKIKEQRKELMKVLFEKTPDTLKIKQISEEIQQSQAMLLQHTINHYLDLKKILKVDQQEKLNLLYQDLFGCPRQMDKKCGSDCIKEEESIGGKGDGTGGGNRHRHGQGHDKKNDL